MGHHPRKHRWVVRATVPLTTKQADALAFDGPLPHTVKLRKEHFDSQVYCTVCGRVYGTVEADGCRPEIVKKDYSAWKELDENGS